MTRVIKRMTNVCQCPRVSGAALQNDSFSKYGPCTSYVASISPCRGFLRIKASAARPAKALPSSVTVGGKGTTLVPLLPDAAVKLTPAGKVSSSCGSTVELVMLELCPLVTISASYMNTGEFRGTFTVIGVVNPLVVSSVPVAGVHRPPTAIQAAPNPVLPAPVFCSVTDSVSVPICVGEVTPLNVSTSHPAEAAVDCAPVMPS